MNEKTRRSIQRRNISIIRKDMKRHKEQEDILRILKWPVVICRNYKKCYDSVCFHREKHPESPECYRGCQIIGGYTHSTCKRVGSIKTVLEKH